MTRVIGVDIGSFSVKIAELECTSQMRSLVALHEFPLKNPADHSEQNPYEIIKNYVEQKAINERAERISVGLGSIPILFRRLYLPFTDREKIIQAASAEFEDLLPMTSTEANIVDACVFTKKGKISTCLAGLVSSDLVTKLQDGIEKTSGLMPHGYFVDTEALAQMALSHSLPLGFQDSPYVLIDIGESHTKLVMIKGARPKDFDKKAAPSSVTPEVMEMRVLTKGFTDCLKFFSEANKKSLTEAKAHFQTANDLDDEMKQSLRTLLVEIYQTLQSFRTKHSQAGAQVSLSGAYVTGGLTSVKGLTEFLSTEFRLPVYDWPLNIGLDTSRCPIQPEQEKVFAVALSLALRFAIPKPMGWLNFKRASETNKKIIRDFIQSILAPELASVRQAYGLALLFVTIYSAMALFLAKTRSESVQTAIVSEIRKFDQDLGKRAKNFVSDPKRTKELFEQSRNKKLRAQKSEEQVEKYRAHLEYLYDISDKTPSGAVLRLLEVSSSQLKTEMTLKSDTPEQEIQKLAAQVKDGLKRKGYVDVNVQQSRSKENNNDWLLAFNAKWGGQ